LKYEPDLVIVQIGENDYWNLNESNITEYYDVSFIKKLLLGTELFLNYSKLFRFIKLLSVSSNKENYVDDNFYSDLEPVTERTEGKKYRFSLTDPASTIAYTRLINDNFTKIVQIAKKNNVRIIFLRYHVGGYRSIHFYQEQIFNQLNVPYVNNRSLFLEAEKRGINPFGRDKWHPGDDGYLLIAKNIYNKLISLEIVKGLPFEIFE
jgi:lysophospholipase L1-like esterase